MFIPLLSSILDDVDLKGKQRSESTRHVLRVLLKLATYSEVKFALRDTVGRDIERVISQHISNLAWNEALQLRMWRAFYAYVHSKDDDSIAGYGMTLADLYYINDHLRSSDISAIRYSDLDYTKAPITQEEIQHILRKSSVRSTVKHFARKSRYVSEIEPAFDICDFESDLEVHAIMTIYRYEACRSTEHIINSVNQALANFWRDTCDTWNAAKRTGAGRNKIDTGRKDKNGKPIYEYENQSIRVPMTLSDDRGIEVDHPELHKRSVNISSEIEVRNFVERVSATIPRYGRFLRIVVLDEPDAKCDKWLSRNMKLSRRELRLGVDDEHYRECLMQYCKVTRRDQRRAEKLFNKNENGEVE